MIGSHPHLVIFGGNRLMPIARCFSGGPCNDRSLCLMLRCAVQTLIRSASVSAFDDKQTFCHVPVGISPTSLSRRLEGRHRRRTSGCPSSLTCSDNVLANSVGVAPDNAARGCRPRRHTSATLMVTVDVPRYIRTVRHDRPMYRQEPSDGA